MIRQRGRFTERGDVAVLRSVLSVVEFYPNVLRDLRYVVSMTLTLLFFLNVIGHHIFQTPENNLFSSKIVRQMTFAYEFLFKSRRLSLVSYGAKHLGSSSRPSLGRFFDNLAPELRNDVRQLPGMTVRSINALSLSRLLDPK